MISEPTKASPLLTEALSAARDDYNRRYARARQERRQLDPEAFSRFLLEMLDPLLQGVQASATQRSELVSAAYDAGLVLVGQDLLRNDHRGQALGRLWTDVLPTLGPHLLAAPQRVLGSLCNASIQISGMAGARGNEWLDRLARFGSQCDSVDCLLRLTQVLAWQAGLAHYRNAALDLLATLPGTLAARVLDLPQGERAESAIAQLRNNPWWQVDDAPRSLREVARVGSFVGFGGLFSEPPRVHALEQQLFVSSGLRVWLLCADAYGASLHPALPAESERLRTASGCGASLSGKRVLWRGQAYNVDDVRSLSCAAETEHTLAVCSSDTHAVILLAGPGR